MLLVPVFQPSGARRQRGGAIIKPSGYPYVGMHADIDAVAAVAIFRPNVALTAKDAAARRVVALDAVSFAQRAGTGFSASIARGILVAVEHGAFGQPRQVANIDRRLSADGQADVLVANQVIQAIIMTIAVSFEHSAPADRRAKATAVGRCVRVIGQADVVVIGKPDQRALMVGAVQTCPARTWIAVAFAHTAGTLGRAKIGIGVVDVEAAAAHDTVRPLVKRASVHGVATLLKRSYTNIGSISRNGNDYPVPGFNFIAGIFSRRHQCFGLYFYLLMGADDDGYRH